MKNIYPWIDEFYKKIIFTYKIKNSNHPIMIISIDGLGIDILINKLVSWFMCEKKSLEKFCKKCKNCKLVSLNFHPNWYIIKIEEKKKFINIEQIQILIKKIYLHPYYKKLKIVWIPNINELTESAINALLKILEEPPKNIRFIINTNQYSKLLPTLTSRCIKLKFEIPDEKNSFFWMKKQHLKNFEEKTYLTALRINGGAPIAAISFIKKKWNYRCDFYNSFYYAIKDDILKLFDILNDDKIIFKIHWICLILIDAIKWEQKNKKLIVNLDQKFLIEFIAKKFIFSKLVNSILHWKMCHNFLIDSFLPNRKLVLIKTLLNWKLILYSNINSNFK